MPELFLNGRVSLHCGDCLEVLAGIEENSIDSVVTDPPYHLTSIVKRFGAAGAAPAKVGKTGAYERASRGFMGKVWDGGDIAFQPETWAAVMRVLKPGGHLVAFGASKNSHRLTCAIEDAGFEIRDMIAWLFGSGFPKSHDVSKGIDSRKDWKSLALLGAAIKAARTKLGISQTEAARRVGLIAEGESLGGGGFMWFETGRMPTRDEWPRIKAALSLGDEFDESFEAAERETIGQHGGTSPGTNMRNGLGGQQKKLIGEITKATSILAAEWEGWGTALKPAIEPITLARKPLSEGTVAANVLRWRTGALNIDGCRIHADDAKGYEYTVARTMPGAGQNKTGERKQEGVTFTGQTKDGRWPANVAHDGSAEVVEAFPAEAGAGGQASGQARTGRNESISGSHMLGTDDAAPFYADAGSAARFYYSAKADAEDRIGSKHPTVKPIDLVRWLVRMVTPPGGVVIDPFAGTGTLGEAAWLEGAQAVLIERESEYQADIRRRMKLCLSGPDEKARESIKAKTAGKPIDAGPLFGGEA